MPAHTHTRGTMDITGNLNHNNQFSGSIYSSKGLSGAFYATTESSPNYYINQRETGSGWYNIGFKASNSWTGETSSVGNGEAFSNMPPYLAVTVWKRIQ